MVTGLVLAAGAGRRLGQPKAELIVRGERLIDHAVATLREGGCEDVIAVVRSAAVIAPGARSVVNSAPDDGMGSSLRIGLAEVQANACVILLVDQVGITASDVAAVIAAHHAGADVVVARRSGHRSHPVLVAREWFDEFGQAASGDRGARDFIDRHADLIEFLDFADQISDIDTPDDLQAL